MKLIRYPSRIISLSYQLSIIIHPKKQLFLPFYFFQIGCLRKKSTFMITVFLHNSIQTISNQVHIQNLTYNYTIIVYTNLYINLNWSPNIQISETTFFTFMKKVKHFYLKSQKKHFYLKSRSTFIIKVKHFHEKSKALLSKK